MASADVHLLERRAAWVAGAFACALVTLLAWGEYSAWRSEVATVERETRNLAVSFVQHAEDTIEQTHAPLMALVAEIEYEGTGDRGKTELRVLMDRLKAQSPNILDLFVYDEQGSWLETTAANIPPNANNSDREYFQAHRASEDLAPRIGYPVKSRSTGQWIIPVTMRFNKADRSFGGVVLASIACRHFSDFFLSFDTGRNGSALLLLEDGTILSRTPFDEAVIGTNISKSPNFVEHLSRFEMGSFHYKSPFDGVDRIGGFYGSRESGLIVLTAVSESEALGSWLRNAISRWLTLVIVVATGAVLALLLHRRIQRQRRTDDRLAAREAEFKLLTQYSHDLVERIDVKGIRRYVSPAANVVLGRSPEELVGTNAFDSIAPAHKDEIQSAVRRLWNGSQSETIEFRSIREGNLGAWLETNLSVLPGTPDNPGGVVAVTRDISARKNAELQLAELASMDGLTGLANRRAFDESFGAEFKRAQRAEMPLSVILIDVDRFKLYNDSYGHLAGDGCLRQISGAIANCAGRAGDLVARYGGEEIVVLLPNTDGSGAMEVAERMRHAVEDLNIPHDKNVPFGCVTISAGLATADFASGEETPERLLDAADWGLYRAKENGRNQVVAFTAETSKVHGRVAG